MIVKPPIHISRMCKAMNISCSLRGTDTLQIVCNLSFVFRRVGNLRGRIALCLVSPNPVVRDVFSGLLVGRLFSGRRNFLVLGLRIPMTRLTSTVMKLLRLFLQQNQPVTDPVAEFSQVGLLREGMTSSLLRRFVVRDLLVLNGTCRR